MEISLTNETLSVHIQTSGAEIQSITHNQHAIDYMWDGNPKFWGRRAPVLFPIVGQLKHNQYVLNGKHFEMKRHGFARDSEFEVLASSPTQATFRLRASAESLLQYPFEFEFDITYVLTGNSLDVQFEVKNLSKEAMPFSIGGHPAFRCPLLPGTSFQDYFLSFDQLETAPSHRLTGGLFDGQISPKLQGVNKLPLSHRLFAHDALVFKHLASNEVTLASDKHPHSVKLRFDDFPYLGIWTAPKAPFVCLEPWLGLADHQQSTGYFLDKEGIQIAMPGQSFTCSYQLTFS